ncbi:MAG: ABC transporter substrate-binding protein, partial [Crocinitomicaceae bacterium]|nr:ABC transporter substrate-binding protein [Crocinitomicaceae bacterium]
QPSPGKYIFDNADKSEESNYIGFKAIDDRTFCIYLKRPQPSFLNMLCLKHCSVVPYEAIDLYGEDFRANPVGTGPFKFAFWNEDVKLVLLKNDEYWDRSENGDTLPYLDAITITFLPDRHQEYMQFKLGKYEMISGLDQSFQETLLTDFGELKESLDSTMTFTKLPWLKTDYLGFLVDTTKKVAKNSPLSNRLVRQAVNYALDRDELVTYMRKNIGKGASRGFLPRGMPGFDQLTVARNEFDPEKSRELLRKAGYAGEPIKLIVANQYKQMCNYIQRKLKEVGLDVQVDAVSKSVHRKDMATFQANFFLKNWTADYPDPTNFYQLFYSNNFAPENGPNYTHFNNKKYDECFERLLEETNDSVKWSLCNQLEAILVEDAPIIPLFYDETVRFFSPRVTGIKANSMNQLDLSEVKMNN